MRYLLGFTETLERVIGTSSQLRYLCLYFVKNAPKLNRYILGIFTVLDLLKTSRHRLRQRSHDLRVYVTKQG